MTNGFTYKLENYTKELSVFATRGGLESTVFYKPQFEVRSELTIKRLEDDVRS